MNHALRWGDELPHDHVCAVARLLAIDEGTHRCDL